MQKKNKKTTTNFLIINLLCLNYVCQVPKQIQGLKSEVVTHIAAARDHSVFLTQRLVCWRTQKL